MEKGRRNIVKCIRKYVNLHFGFCILYRKPLAIAILHLFRHYYYSSVWICSVQLNVVQATIPYTWFYFFAISDTLYHHKLFTYNIYGFCTFDYQFRVTENASHFGNEAHKFNNNLSLAGVWSRIFIFIKCYRPAYWAIFLHK